VKTTAIVPTLLALAAISGATVPAFAQTEPKEAEAKNLPQAEGKRIEVQPGNQPTRSMTETVEPMDKSATGPQVHAEGQHAPTAGVGSAVPPMTPRNP